MSNKIETNVVKPEMVLRTKSKNEELELRLISSEDENKLDTLMSDIEVYMKENDGKGKSEEEKDSLYEEAKKKWHLYAEYLKNVKFEFFMNRNQWKFLSDLLLNKLDYNVDTLFFAIELVDTFNKSSKENKFKDDFEMLSYKFNATEITYIYHLIAKHTVKGLVKEGYTFSEVLLRIGELSKIINYYDTAAKNLSGDIQDWVTAFEDGVSFDKTSKKEESVKPKVIESSIEELES